MFLMTQDWEISQGQCMFLIGRLEVLNSVSYVLIAVFEYTNSHKTK